MKKIYVSKSDINHRGLFTDENLNKGDFIGVSHVVYDNFWYQVVPIGVFYNHSRKSNCIVETKNNVNLLIADRYIHKGEELIVDYTKQLYLEQPTEDWL